MDLSDNNNAQSTNTSTIKQQLFKSQSTKRQHPSSPDNVRETPRLNSLDDLEEFIEAKISAAVEKVLKQINANPAPSPVSYSSIVQLATHKDTAAQSQSTLSALSPQQTYTARFSGEHLHKFRDYESLAAEIERHRPNLGIKTAFIDNNNVLIIKVTDEKSFDELTKPWPVNAFDGGITQIVKQQNYLVGIRNVHLDYSFYESENLIKPHLLDEYGICRAERIVKKSLDRPLKVVKLTINDKIKYEQLLTLGLHLGKNHFKVEKWNSPPPLKQCFKCQKLGHHASNCTSKDHVCPLCAQSHSLKECPRKDPHKCANCGGAHAALSKSCPRNQAPPTAQSALTRAASTQPKTQPPTQQPINPTIEPAQSTHDTSEIANKLAKVLDEVFKNFTIFTKKTQDRRPLLQTIITHHFSAETANTTDLEFARSSKDKTKPLELSVNNSQQQQPPTQTALLATANHV